MDDRIVIDASVAVRWFLQDSAESELEKALLLLDKALAGDVVLHAPAIFTHEVCGALTKACATRPAGTRISRLTKEDALNSVRDLFQIPINIQATSEQEALEALDLAVTYSKGLYDMTYLRLASSLDCRWCTADEKFLRAVPSSFPKDRVVLLSML